MTLPLSGTNRFFAIILWDDSVGVVTLRRGRTRSEVVLAGNVGAARPLAKSTKLNPSFCGPGQHRPNGRRTQQIPQGGDGHE